MPSAFNEKPGARQFNVLERKAGKHFTIVADGVIAKESWVFFYIGEDERDWIVLMMPERELMAIEEEPLAGKAKLEFQQWNDDVWNKTLGALK